LVKVLNPAFYGGGNTTQTQQSKVQPHQTPSPSSSNFETKKKFVTSTEQKEEITPNTSYNMKPRSSSQITKSSNKKQPSNINNNLYYGPNVNNNTTYAPQRGQNTSMQKLKNVKNSSHFEKDKKPFHKKDYNKLFEGKYSKFLQCVSPLQGVRGKIMNINALIYAIEEIYSIRFINDTNTANNNNDDVEPLPFPNFVVEFYTNKFTKKPMVDQHSLDLLHSIEYYSKIDRDPLIDKEKDKDFHSEKEREDYLNKLKEITTFTMFLNEEYEPDDLEFFLYVRSCIEKEMKIMFIEIARETMKHQYKDDFETNICSLNVKSCLNVANAIYGNDEEELLSSFMKKIEDILTEQREMGNKKNIVSASKILQITLEDYHENKFGDNKSHDGVDNYSDQNELGKTNNNNMPIPIVHKDHSETYNNLQKNYGGGNIRNQEEKIARLKAIIGAYIKEKELDVFFNKLLNSYMIYEKSNKNIEETLASIKELVSRKVNLLIKILFEQDEKAWFNSLKLKCEDQASKECFDKLIQLIEQMMQFDKIQEIPEELVETFGQTLLSTPELNNQINKLVMKRFE
jgi:hypothetical protein